MSSNRNNGFPQFRVLDEVNRYDEAGFSTVPIRRDGSKAPCLRSWNSLQRAKPRLDQIERWFGVEHPPGVGIIGGRVSGNLLVIDVEFLDIYTEWSELVEARRPGLLARLPLVRTPGKDEDGGRHVYARSVGRIIRTQKLARITRDEAERRTGDPGRTTAIEVKGEGGYVLAPGCPAECHPSRRLYEHIGGPPIVETPGLDEADVDLLLACARALERGDMASADRMTSTPSGDGNRPGDDFNRRGSWADVLPAGWTRVREHGDVVYLCRPGKETGVSATIGHCRSDRAGPKLYVFSTNAEPFEADRAYSKFEAFALVRHGGDFRAAAKALAAQGYGAGKNGRIESGVVENGCDTTDPPSAPDPATTDPVHLTDRGNAIRLVRMRGADLRYCHGWHRWLEWDGARWRIDTTAEATRAAKAVAVALWQQAQRELALVRPE